MAALPIVCPAASAIEPPGDAPSVVCGVLENSNDGAHIAGNRDRGQVSPIFSGARDARIVAGFCAGQGIPGSLASYCSCAVWRAEKERIRAGRPAGPNGLRDGQATRPPEIDPELAEFVRMVHGVPTEN